MEGIDLSFPSYAQHERMAAALGINRNIVECKAS